MYRFSDMSEMQPEGGLNLLILQKKSIISENQAENSVPLQYPTGRGTIIGDYVMFTMNGQKT